MARLGGVFRRDGHFFAKVDTHAMQGTLCAAEQEAVQDLDYIRSAAEGGLTWAEGLQSMKLAGKELRGERKAEAQVKKLVANKAKDES